MRSLSLNLVYFVSFSISPLISGPKVPEFFPPSFFLQLSTRFTGIHSFLDRTFKLYMWALLNLKSVMRYVRLASVASRPPRLSGNMHYFGCQKSSIDVFFDGLTEVSQRTLWPPRSFESVFEKCWYDTFGRSRLTWCFLNIPLVVDHVDIFSIDINGV